MKRPDPNIPAHGDYWLTGVRAPDCLLGPGPSRPDAEGLVDIDMLVRDGNIADIAPAGAATGTATRVERAGGIVLPRLADIHTHIDKGHIIARRPNPDGTHWGARTSVAADRETNWTAEDVHARMEFALRCAFAHGTKSLRTHIDSLGKQAAITWPVVERIRAEWKDRVTLQAVALFPIDLALDDEPQFRALVERVARAGGVLGGMTFLGQPPGERSRAALERVFDAAAVHGLDLDFHVDESDSLDARSLGEIADMIARKRFRGRVVAGHCCSLSLFDDDTRSDIVARVADSGLAVVSLPMCNMYLQDRSRGRTPRWRGVTALHELAAAGVPVMVSSDNTRDPFHAYGDLDLLEVFREATRILQLDHCESDWIRVVASAPANVMGLGNAGQLRIGQPADLILLDARTLNELNCRPQNDRVVLVGGRPIDTRPPDYRELDAVLGLG
jgi:cytosine deaminase